MAPSVGVSSISQDVGNSEDVAHVSDIVSTLLQAAADCPSSHRAHAVCVLQTLLCVSFHIAKTETDAALLALKDPKFMDACRAIQSSAPCVKLTDLELANPALPNAEVSLRLYEQSATSLTSLYALESNAPAIRELLLSSFEFFKLLPKARTARLVRVFVDSVAAIPSAQGALVSLCTECVDWCVAEKRTFLRHRIQLKLASVYLSLGRNGEAQQVLSTLLLEVKKLDDKLLLVEIHLLESKSFYQVQNVPRARASLTAARTNANAIHCPPLLQGQIDMQAGILHAHDCDYKTSFSYFFEAFEAFSAQEATQQAVKSRALAQAQGLDGGTSSALIALKYMLLSKILMGRPDDAASLLTGKQGLRYYQQLPTSSKDAAGARSSSDLEALRLLAVCYKQRSLKMFEDLLTQYAVELKGDPVMQHHIGALYETLLEQNLNKILQPYSRVELSHVASRIGLPLVTVEKKLSEMVLDGKLLGTLDQGVGVLMLFEDTETPKMYGDVLGTIDNMGNVVDSLYDKAQQAL